MLSEVFVRPSALHDIVERLPTSAAGSGVAGGVVCRSSVLVCHVPCRRKLFSFLAVIATETVEHFFSKVAIGEAFDYLMYFCYTHCPQLNVHNVDVVGIVGHLTVMQLV